MTKFLWWLSPADIAAIGDPRETWPSWLREEYTSLRGRAGRGRLWVACEIFGHDTEVALALDADLWQTPMGTIAERCGGIMIREEDLPLLADLPGLVTDLHLRRPAPLVGAAVEPLIPARFRDLPSDAFPLLTALSEFWPPEETRTTAEVLASARALPETVAALERAMGEELCEESLFRALASSPGIVPAVVGWWRWADGAWTQAALREEPIGEIAAHAAVAKDLAALLKAARLVCERAGEIGLARIEDDLLRARVEDLRDAVAEAEGR